MIFQLDIQKLLAMKKFEGQILLRMKDGKFILIPGSCPKCYVTRYLSGIHSYILLKWEDISKFPNEQNEQNQHQGEDRSGSQ